MMPLHKGLRLLPMPLATRALPDRDEKQTGPQPHITSLSFPVRNIPLSTHRYGKTSAISRWAPETYLRGANSLPGGFLVYLTEVAMSCCVQSCGVYAVGR